MRVSREKLIFHALCVLEQLRGECRKGPVEGDCDARLALAVLFALGKSGDRQCYDEFWRNLTTGHPSGENQGNIARAANATRWFNGILHDVGAPLDPEFSGQISRVAHALERKRRKPSI